MMKQYMAIKEQVKTVYFSSGWGLYEMFFDDAIVASKYSSSC